MKDMKNDSGIRKTFAQFNIQSIILSVLMTLSLVTVTVMGFLLYHRFKLASDKSAVANTEMTVESTIDRLNSSLLDVLFLAFFNISLIVMDTSISHAASVLSSISGTFS